MSVGMAVWGMALSANGLVVALVQSKNSKKEKMYDGHEHKASLQFIER